MAKNHIELFGMADKYSRDMLIEAYDKGYEQGYLDGVNNMAKDFKAELEKKNEYEKDYEGCDKCIFDGMNSVDMPCRRCKYNSPACTDFDSYFIPKPCQHEWEIGRTWITIQPNTSNELHERGKDVCYCKKCGILRIEV